MVILPTLKKSFTRSKILQKKKREYSESFAIHGLSRVFHGTKLEQIFWLINLLLSLGVAVFLIRKQVTSYLNKEIYIDESNVIDNKVGFPTITLCVNEDQPKLQYCNRIVSKYEALSETDRYPCRENDEANTQVTPFKFTFGFAELGRLFQLRCRDSCEQINELTLWQPIANFTNCVQFNGPKNKNTKIIKDHFSYSFTPRIEINDLEIYFHEREEKPYAERRGGVRISHLQNTDIQIQKTIKTKRLEAPYPSKCVTEKKGRLLNIFSWKIQCASLCRECQMCRKF